LCDVFPLSVLVNANHHKARDSRWAYDPGLLLKREWKVILNEELDTSRAPGLGFRLMDHGTQWPDGFAGEFHLQVETVPEFLARVAIDRDHWFPFVNRFLSVVVKGERCLSKIASLIAPSSNRR
jgi:hypothetical protein